MNDFIPNWSAPASIRAITTTRLSGVSCDVYASNNLAYHVQDNPEHVHANRQALVQRLQLPHEPIWLNQTHSTRCVIVENANVDREADAAITRHRQFPLAIMTADCLPILICNRQGDEIAAIHAGWRGLVNGIIENTVRALSCNVESCIAWIGPAICANCYETGDEVFQAFTKQYAFAHQAFHYHQKRIHANLSFMAELILLEMGISAVYQSNACTFETTDQFYSYRRSAQTGRIATLIWFQDKSL